MSFIINQKIRLRAVLKKMYLFTLKSYSRLASLILSPFTKKKIIEGRTLLKNIRPPLSAYETNKLISEMLMSNKPFFVTRLGDTETKFLSHYLEVNSFSKVDKVFYFLIHLKWAFTLKKRVAKKVHTNAGLFPINKEILDLFYEKMINSMPQVDLLASWVPGENYFEKYLKSAKTCDLPEIESYLHSNPWSQHLKGKHVLVIHPFSKSIEKQYTINRTRLFRDPLVLPEFKLSTLTAVQSVAGNRPKEFKDWFQALNFMYTKSLEINPDVVILGCGAYGFPLGAMLKAAGKQVIQLGGSTQILFGIKGLRWDNNPKFQNLYNKYWIRASEQEIPKNYRSVENGCYW